MSLVVRPKRANKKAIDYAQLANGSMSVEDADESPPPQSAGNGKRKLEPTGGSSKAPKGKAPAGKAPAAVPAPALLIDRDTDLEPLSPEIQAKLLALFREADDLTARWRPTAQTLLASIRSKMVVRAEQSNEYTRTVSRFAPGEEMVRTEELSFRGLRYAKSVSPAAVVFSFVMVSSHQVASRTVRSREELAFLLSVLAHLRPTPVRTKVMVRAVTATFAAAQRHFIEGRVRSVATA